MDIANTVDKNKYKKDRVILHSDCNGFYASVECLNNPKIRNKPVAVSGDAENRHGIILAKNEAAKKYGVKTGEAIWQAKQKCPELVTVPPHFDEYKRFSTATRRIYGEYTDLVEPFGLDEAWLDITESSNANGYATALEIRKRIKYELGITVSIGVSFNKVFAKFGSDYKKPDAVTVIDRNNFKDIIWRAPAQDLLYVGRSTRKKLNNAGIYTIGDIAVTPPSVLHNLLGKWGRLIYGFANGFDSSPVARINDKSEIKSIGNSTTTPVDMKSCEEVKTVMYVLCDSVCRRMREKGFMAKNVEISLRDSDLHTFSRRRSLDTYTNLTTKIRSAAMELVRHNYNFNKPLRSVGVAVSDFIDEDIPRQLDFFEDAHRQLKNEALDKTIDVLKRRFGNYILCPAVLLKNKRLSAFNPKDEHTIHPVSYL